MYEFIIELLFKIPVILPIITIVMPFIFGLMIKPKYSVTIASVLVLINIVNLSFSSHPTIGINGISLYIFSFWGIILYILSFAKHFYVRRKYNHISKTI